MKISMIVATDLNGGIGANGGIPWHIPSELKYFKAVTSGSPIIMGRKTFESLPGPLPNRLNLVVSKSLSKGIYDGYVVVSSPEKALEFARQYKEGRCGDPSEVHPEVFIIGGAQLYKTFENQCSTVYLTKVHKSYTVDTVFDDSFLFGKTVPKDMWRLSTSSNVPEKDNLPSYTTSVYTKNQQSLIL